MKNASTVQRKLFSESSEPAGPTGRPRASDDPLVRTPLKSDTEYHRSGQDRGRARRSESRKFRETHLLATQAHDADPGAGSRARRRAEMHRGMSEKYLIGIECFNLRKELESQREFIRANGTMRTPGKLLPGGHSVPQTLGELEEMIARLDAQILQINAQHSAAAVQVRRGKDDRLEELVDLSAATRDALNNYRSANEHNKGAEGRSYRQLFWNAVAGADGYLPFGVGAAVAQFSNGFAGAATAAVLWFLNERIGPPLLRSVSQPNLAADRSMTLYKLGADALEERIVSWFGIAVQPNRVMLVEDEVRPVTAMQMRERAQQRANASQLTLYRLKVIPDDVTSCFYGIHYAIRNLVCGHYFAELSRPAPGQVATLANRLFETGTFVGAGILAGMFYSLSMQAARRHYADLINQTLGGAENASLPIVTKTFAIWRLRALYLNHYLLDLQRAAAREGLADDDRLYINAVADIVSAKLARAQSKSGFLGNLALEARAMVKPGERRNNAANLISKFTCLCLYATVGTLYLNWQPSGDLASDAVHYLFKGASIVFPLAYPNRTEWFGLAVYTLAAANGLRRGLSHQIALKAAHVGDGLYSMLGCCVPDFTIWRTGGGDAVTTNVLPLQTILVDQQTTGPEQPAQGDTVVTIRRFSVERTSRKLQPGGRSARTLPYDAGQTGALAQAAAGERADGRADHDRVGKSPGSAVRQRKLSTSRQPSERSVGRTGSGLRTPGESPTKAVLARARARTASGSAVMDYSDSSGSESSDS